MIHLNLLLKSWILELEVNKSIPLGPTFAPAPNVAHYYLRRRLKYLCWTTLSFCCSYPYLRSYGGQGSLGYPVALRNLRVEIECEILTSNHDLLGLLYERMKLLA